MGIAGALGALYLVTGDVGWAIAFVIAPILLASADAMLYVVRDRQRLTEEAQGQAGPAPSASVGTATPADDRRQRQTARRSSEESVAREDSSDTEEAAAVEALRETLASHERGMSLQAFAALARQLGISRRRLDELIHKDAFGGLEVRRGTSSSASIRPSPATVEEGTRGPAYGLTSGTGEETVLALHPPVQTDLATLQEVIDDVLAEPDVAARGDVPDRIQVEPAAQGLDPQSATIVIAMATAVSTQVVERVFNEVIWPRVRQRLTDR